jgi:catalase-peroxidase
MTKAPCPRTFVSLMWLPVGLLTACASKEAPVTPSTSSSPAEAHAAVTVKDGAPKPNRFWWPEQVDLSPLRDHQDKGPYGDEFDYKAAFETLDYEALKKDIESVLTDSQDWWPADYGNYGPFFIRLAWHSAGTYRVWDGRGGSDGGQIRFEPLNSWPDNANLDKARRLLWPVKQKYGNQISWSDLMILTGNVALESMGFETLGFAGGRVDDWEAEMVYWGPESQMLASDRFHGERELHEPLAATRMGLIYVNPQGPDGNSDPKAAAHDIRSTFGLMGMNDEETVALIAGGHTFGKAHGAHNPDDCVDVEPAGEDVEAQGTGWHNKCGTGHGADTVTSGLEGAWTSEPAKWTHQYMANLYGHEWEKTESPAGATQWKPKNDGGAGVIPDAHDPEKSHAPMMFTTDLTMREDSGYGAISKRFHENPEEFERAFAEAWFKLTHRDLGPRSRYLGPEIPAESFIWQDPLPSAEHPSVNDAQVTELKASVLASGLSTSELIRTAWASASTFRNSDMRGGANGARIRFDSVQSWDIHDSDEIEKVLAALDGIRADFNEAAADGVQISTADLVILAGAAALEQAGAVSVPFAAGRTDASEEQTDPDSFGYLELSADGFRNYHSGAARLRSSDALIERADLLGLTPAEMTALIGGLRVLGANAQGASHGVFTTQVGTLSNDFFVNLLDLSTTWSPTEDGNFEGRGSDGEVRWTATEVDLVFGSNSELRAICEVYAYDEAKFQADFVRAWTKVMQADRFDL